MRHGTRYAHDFHGCRCDACLTHMAPINARYRERKRNYQRRYRASHLETLRAYHREWMRRYRASQRMTA